MRDSQYVLVSAVKNEEAYIGKMLQSVVSQTRLPKVWIIVSDGSTDRTDETVMDFAEGHDFIRLIRLDNDGARAFSSQAFASNAGYQSVKQSEFDCVGFLDADISFDPGYYDTLLKRFEANPQLGIAGGGLLENQFGSFALRVGNSEDWVPGAIQLFRRQCFEDIGEFIPLHYGGHDTLACAKARQKGWEVRSFLDVRVFHHRPTGTAGTTRLRASFRQGMEDYFLGYHPLFEAAKCVRRIAERPFCVGSVLRLCGYVFPGVTLQKRTIPDELFRYMRQAQMRRVLDSVLGR